MLKFPSIFYNLNKDACLKNIIGFELNSLLLKNLEY